MATIRMHVRDSRTSRLFGLVLAGAIAGFALATCGGDPAADEATEEIETETNSEALSQAQCQYLTKGGKGRICHYDSKKKKFIPTDVDNKTCCSHTGHKTDYMTTDGDKTCVGGGCVPVGVPCDSTLKCCTGLSCIKGKCAIPACLPVGSKCTILTGAVCCGPGCQCLNPNDPTDCKCPS